MKFKIKMKRKHVALLLVQIINIIYQPLEANTKIHLGKNLK